MEGRVHWWQQHLDQVVNPESAEHLRGRAVPGLGNQVCSCSRGQYWTRAALDDGWRVQLGGVSQP